MSRAAKILIWVFLGAPAIIVALLFIAFQVLIANLEPDHAFGEKPLPMAPDYLMRSNWSGWPGPGNPADRLPPNVEPVPYEKREAAAFFLHPTTYGSTDDYVQPMDHEESRRGTDLGTVSIQASVFNDCCTVYAPRYRQSGIAFPEESLGEQLSEIGYLDIQNAFLYFLEEIGDEKPFVLAGHSQGTFHLVRLVMEEVSGTPLMDRLIAIYAIGNSLPEELVEIGLPDIEICENRHQIGCFISWDSYREDREPSFFENVGERETVWNGINYSGYKSNKKICVNPITWTTDDSLSDKADHLGALPASKQDNYGSLADPLSELIKNDISVYCHNDSSNWLLVNPDRSEKLKTPGWFRLFEGNLHGYDYQYYWADIRQNARDRTNRFLELRDQK
jgi:hypothetical protein